MAYSLDVSGSKSDGSASLVAMVGVAVDGIEAKTAILAFPFWMTVQSDPFAVVHGTSVAPGEL